MTSNPRVREEAVNLVLASLLSKKIGEWLSVALGESVLKTPHRKKLPDIYFVEYYGMKIVFEAKLGFSNIKQAVEKCRERIHEGLANICFAISYDENVAEVNKPEELEEKLLSSPVRVVIVSEAKIDGIELGDIKIEDLVSALNKKYIYEEIISKETAVSIANELEQVLDELSNLPQDVVKNIAFLAEEELNLESHPTVEEDEEE